MMNDKGFEALVLFMYDNVVPEQGYTFVDENENMRAFYARTGMIPLLDEGADEPYQLFAWIKYREFSAHGSNVSLFKLLVNDVLHYNAEHKGCDVGRCVTMLDAIVNVSQEYDEKFKHMPVNLNKFVTSFVKHGRASVLRADIY